MRDRSEGLTSGTQGTKTDKTFCSPTRQAHAHVCCVLHRARKCKAMDLSVIHELCCVWIGANLKGQGVSKPQELWQYRKDCDISGWMLHFREQQVAKKGTFALPWLCITGKPSQHWEQHDVNSWMLHGHAHILSVEEGHLHCPCTR